jgi:hypothetical protein
MAARIGVVVGASLLLAAGAASAQSFLDFAHARVLLQPDVGAAAEAGDQFGSALATGDIDGDGYDDLVVGAPYEDFQTTVDAGAVYVYRGSPHGLVGDRFLVASDAGQTPVASDLLGGAIALGDLNGDGYDDVVVGAQGFGSGNGAVFVWYGSADGLVTPGIAYELFDVGCGPFSGLFGFALAIGDLNGDGYADLAASAPLFAVAVGAVCIVPGTATGLVAGSGALRLENTGNLYPNEPVGGDEFGYALAIGDVFSTDGFGDLVVGAPGAGVGDNPSGIAPVYRGQSATSAADFFSDAYGFTDTNSPQTGEEFGHALALGRVDDFDVDWLLVGAPAYGGGAGRAIAIRAVSGLGVGSFALDQTDDVPGSASEPNDAFGSAVAIADLDGDGFGDLVVGVPGEDANAGAVDVFRGRPGGHRPGAEHTKASFPIPGAVRQAGDYYGYAIATGDFDGDGRAELVVGAPGDAISGATAGAVYVVPEPAPLSLGAAVAGALLALAGSRRAA